MNIWIFMVRYGYLWGLLGTNTDGCKDTTDISVTSVWEEALESWRDHFEKTENFFWHIASVAELKPLWGFQ